MGVSDLVGHQHQDPEHVPEDRIIERREFHDVNGEAWAAFEMTIPASEWTHADEQADEAGYGVGWLYFDCEGRRLRRLRLYPKNWRTRSDDELVRLCRRSRAVPTVDR